MLTKIPEQNLVVKHRLTVVICGKGAKDFSTRLVNSELAQEILTKSEAQGKAEKADIQKDQAPGRSRSTSKTISEDCDGVLFLPVGESTTDLARLRFKACERFSDSLPCAQDRSAAASMIVAFLFWQAAENGTDEDAKVAAAKEVVREWQSRMAEIYFQKQKLRPSIAILAYGLSEGQQDVVSEFVNNAKEPVLKLFSDDCDDEGCMDSMQDMVDKVVANEIDKLKRNNSLASWTGGAGNGRSKCECMIA